MVAQKERIGGTTGSTWPAGVPGPLVRRPSTRSRMRRHGRVTLLVGTVLTTMAVGFWRLSGAEDAGGRSSIRSQVVVGTGGTVDVVQRVSFGTPRSRLVVSIPARSAPGPQFEPRVTELRLRVDGRAAPGLSRQLETGESHTFSFDEPVTSVVLAYAVDGAIAGTGPSVEGRALALMTPLVIAGTEALDSRLEIDGNDVLNLGCAAHGEPTTVCGAESGQVWVVGRRAGDPVVDVVAQVDLTGP